MCERVCLLCLSNPWPHWHPCSLVAGIGAPFETNDQEKLLQNLVDMASMLPDLDDSRIAVDGEEEQRHADEYKDMFSHIDGFQEKVEAAAESLTPHRNSVCVNCLCMSRVSL